jgi:cation diffusion facilitator family transporter
MAYAKAGTLLVMRKKLLTSIGVFSSVLLFALKLWAAYATSSLAILSDALNSFLDVFSYSAVHISALIQEKGPDDDHHFGHRRAEPLAGLVIAILGAVLGTNILKDAITGFVHPKQITILLPAILVLVFNILLKVVLSVAYKRTERITPSAALRASYIDSRNDVLASTVALVGFMAGPTIDALAGLAIGIWIIISGCRVGLENMGYLMGSAPANNILENICTIATNIPGVAGVNEIRAHYVGDVLHVEIHIRVPETLMMAQAHDLSMTIRHTLEEHPDVQRAFIHLEPALPEANN